MRKHFEVKINFKVKVSSDIKGEGTAQQKRYVRQLVTEILKDEEALSDIYRSLFHDLVLSESYDDEIKKVMPLKSETEIILSAASRLTPGAALFFKNLFTGNPDERTNDDQDKVMNFFYEHFGWPEISLINFDNLDSGQ